VFSFNWLWGSKPQDKSEPQKIQTNLELDDFVDEGFDDSDNEIRLLPASHLKNLKRNTHNQLKRTYYFVNSGKNNIQLYCIDAGEDKWIRKVEINQDFINRLKQIDPAILEPVEEEMLMQDRLQQTESTQWYVDNEEKEEKEESFNEDKMNKLRELIAKRDDIKFQIVNQKNFNAKNFSKNLIEDAYFLVKGKKGVYELYYYHAETKSKIPLLAYEASNDTWDSLPELREDAKDKSLFENVHISEEGIEGFRGMLASIVKGDEFKEEQNFSPSDATRMREFLNAYHEKPPSPDLYQKLEKIVVQITKHVDSLLESTLDPYYYDKYFKDAEKDKDGKYILPAVDSENEKILSYMRFGNMLIDMKLFFHNTSKVHGKIIQPYILYNLIHQVPALQENTTALLTAYNSLYSYIEPLGAMTLLRNLSSTTGLKHELQKLIPIDTRLAQQQLTTNPFYLSHLNQGENWVAMLQGTDDKINALQKILNDLSKNLPKGGSANENIQNTIADINKILLEVNRLQGSSMRLLDVLKMVYEVYPKVTALIKQLPKSYVSLQTVFKDHLLMTAEQMNLIFRDTYLKLDQYEIDHHLKKGTLTNYKFADNTSIDTMLQSFHAMIAEAGYEFRPEERFPYLAAMIEQYDQMLTYPNPPEKILLARIQSAEQELQQQAEESPRQVSVREQTNRTNIKVDILLDGHIDKISQENKVLNYIGAIFTHQLNLVRKGLEIVYLDSLFNTVTDITSAITRKITHSDIRDQKVRLLGKLKRTLINTGSLDAALQELHNNNPLDRRKIPLLWKGETGKLLKEIQMMTGTSPVTISDLVNFEINRLKETRIQRIILWGKAKRNANETKILALEKLKKLLLKDGFTINDALSELNAVNPQDYKVLITKNKELINELQNANDYISKERHGNKLLDYVKPENLEFTPREIQLKYGYVKNEIEKRINQLTAEFTNSWFTSNVKLQKIALLNELKLQLNFRPLEAALENIARNKQYQQSFYLLREGRTGILMNNLELSDVNPSEKSKYVDHAIQRLKRMRVQPYSLFSEQEQFIEDRIYALSQLKAKLLANPTHLLSDALNNLFPEQRDLLIEYEQGLFKTLGQWDIIKTAKTEYQVVTLAQNVAKEEAAPALRPRAASIVKPAEPAAAAPVVYDETVYKTTLDNIIYLETAAKDFIKASLNNNIYQDYFANAATDPEGRYVINSNEPVQISNYKRFFNILINAQTLFFELDKLHPHLLKIDGTLTGLLKILPSGLSMYSSGTKIGEAYHNLYNDVDELQLFDFINSISTSDGLKAHLKTFMPADSQAHAERFAANPFFQAFNQHEVIFSGSTELSKRLDAIQVVLLALEDELPTSKIARESAQKTADDILNIITQTRKFASSPAELFDALKYVYNIYPSINSLINNSGQTVGTISVLMKERLMIGLQEVNFVLQDVVLGLDRFKINNFLTDNGAGDIMQYQFQDGVSLDTILSGFNGFVEGMGHEFKPKERPPYYESILEQRQGMIYENQLPPEYIADNINSIKAKMKKAGLVSLRHEVAEETGLSNQRNSAILALMDQRISQLTNERNKWYNFARTKDTKLHLLQVFKAKIVHQPSFDQVIKQMERDPATRNDLHQLWEGRTGLMLLQIQKVLATTDDIIEMIDHEIVSINHDSQNFFSLQSRQDINTGLVALQRLRKLLSSKGYRIDDALAEISGKYPEEYAMLIKAQTPLIEKIRDINAHIVDKEIGKKLIDNFTPVPKFQFREQYAEINYIQNLINNQIDHLNQELNKSVLHKSSSKSAKVDILTELKKQLEHQNLADALEDISKNKKFAKAYPKLFSGRTGVLLKKLETIVLSPEGIIQRIDAEINFIKLERKPKSLLFKDTEKNQQEHIILLEDLKDKLAVDPQFSTLKFYEGLNDRQRQMLKQDSKLLADIREWQHAKAASPKIEPRPRGASSA
jgi:hypothetical protein